MSQTAARPKTRRTHGVLGVVAIIVTAAVAISGYVSVSSAAPSFGHAAGGDTIAVAPGTGGTATKADGVLPDGATVFDEQYPGIASLDPELLRALREAAIDAADDGVALHVNSGWRSAAYQNQLLSEAVAEYGSEAEAARWVAMATTSPHVRGEAADIGPSAAAAWLSRYGAAYGLCQIYGNEPWHYELRPEAISSRCPRMYSDPTRDPRMQR